MSDQYALAAAKVAVAQLADATGFDALQSSSYSILSELMVRYIEEVGRLSHENTELAGRTEPNAMDVLLALNDLGVSVSDLESFKRTQKDLAFAAKIVQFPLEKRTKPTQTFAQRGEVPPAHIPSLLPAFPDRHTYCETADIPRPDPDPTARHLASVENQQEAERALVKLHARAAPEDPVLASALPEESATAGVSMGRDDNQEDAVKSEEAAADLWTAVPSGHFPELQQPPFPQEGGGLEPMAVDDEQRNGDASIADHQPSLPITEPESRAQLAAALAPAFQPYDWQVELKGLAATFQSPTCSSDDAFAAALHGSGGPATKHGRQTKRSARAMDAGHILMDPTRQRVEMVIEASREAEAAGDLTGGAGGEELMYGGGDEDEAEHL